MYKLILTLTILFIRSGYSHELLEFSNLGLSQIEIFPTFDVLEISNKRCGDTTNFEKFTTESLKNYNDSESSYPHLFSQKYETATSETELFRFENYLNEDYDHFVDGEGLKIYSNIDGNCYVIKSDGLFKRSIGESKIRNGSSSFSGFVFNEYELGAHSKIILSFDLNLDWNSCRGWAQGNEMRQECSYEISLLTNRDSGQTKIQITRNCLKPHFTGDACE